jgi:hypothetical protein
MTTSELSPWPLVTRGDQEHPVQTLQYLLRARRHIVVVDGETSARRLRQQSRPINDEGDSSLTESSDLSPGVP